MSKAFKEFIIHCRMKNLSEKIHPIMRNAITVSSNSIPKLILPENITGAVVGNYMFWLKETTGFNDISLNIRKYTKHIQNKN